MRMGMGIGALALLAIVGSAQADAKAPKAPKPGKIRAEAMLGEDGPRLHDFVQWRAVPVVDAPEVPADAAADGATEGEESPADGAAPGESQDPAVTEDDATTEAAPSSEPEEPEGPQPIELGGGELDSTLPPGRYVLEGEISPYVWRQEIEVKSKKRITLAAVFEGAFVEYAPKNAPETFTCGAEAAQFEGSDSFTASKPTRRFFQPGIWEVSCERGVLSTGSTIEVFSGNVVRVTPDLSVGRLEAAVVGAEEYPDEIYFELRDRSPNSLTGPDVAVYAEKGENLAIDVPPGSYEVYAKLAFDRPVPDFFAIEGRGQTTVDIGQTSTMELDAPWALVLPKLEIGRRGRQPAETRWFFRKPDASPDEDAPLAIRLNPEGEPLTIYAYEEPLVLDIRDEYNRLVGTSAPFTPVAHTTTEVPIKIGR